MKLKFKVQQFQTDAVESVINVFAGQPNQGVLAYTMDKEDRLSVHGSDQAAEQLIVDFAEEGYKNGDLVLDQVRLLENIHKVQKKNKIHLSKELIHNIGHCQLDVEMETGTGKTYVYIKTMFELNKQYGWTKFIVVVPGVAIREGVKKSFDITVEHFMEQYGKKARYFIYNSDNLNQIDTFSQSADISVMIINIQAFNSSMAETAKSKAARKIFEKRDEFASRRPIDVIAANRPILILDEPQKMGGNATQKGLSKFCPLFTLNYSATHKESHNPVYVLDALDAYNQKLVKRIEVVGFELKNLMGTDSYIYLSDIILSKSEKPKARLELEVRNKTGNIRRELRKLAEGDNLYDESGEMPQYKGFIISEIKVNPWNSAKSCVTFSNRVTLHVKECQGNITAEHKARIQIRETIKAHFRKESELFHRGIKCLSLFFLDEVANYRKYEDGVQVLGKYGEIFEEEYMTEMNEYRKKFDSQYTAYLDSIPVDKTHAGYFSIDKQGRSVNSEPKRGTDISDDISAYDLILKNKERLLSFEEPVRFIFSHSALREGWDNPNVFQICALRQANAVTQKRQEVGRGLRLCVNKEGVRQDVDVLSENVHKVNMLTVVASEAYATFANDLQKGIREDLYDRPTKANVKFFTGTTIKIDAEHTHTFTEGEAQDIYFQVRAAGYINKDGELLPAFHEAVESKTLQPLTEELEPYTEQVYTLMQSIFDPKVLEDMVQNGGRQTTPNNKFNDNFKKREFQELWSRINHKYAYVVDFNSDELIEKAVATIDKELAVSQLMYRVTRGQQREEISSTDIKYGEMIVSDANETYTVETTLVNHVKYDLLGEIASGTKLTRKTVATILSNISEVKFYMFKSNPEDFIQKVTRLINEQKATIIVEHIEYNILKEKHDATIFTEEKHSTIDNAYEGKKHILDYVFTDGTAKKSVERKFVEELDNAKEVVVYAKLPKGFYIPTPVGNYSPDWAIAFQEGEVKHVYFVAETKGSMSSLQLREIERCKINCAEKLFGHLSTENVKYGKVDSFDTLMNMVK